MPKLGLFPHELTSWCKGVGRSCDFFSKITGVTFLNSFPLESSDCAKVGFFVVNSKHRSLHRRLILLVIFKNGGGSKKDETGLL